MTPGYRFASVAQFSVTKDTGRGYIELQVQVWRDGKHLTQVNIADKHSFDWEDSDDKCVEQFIAHALRVASRMAEDELQRKVREGEDLFTTQNIDKWFPRASESTD